MIADVLLRLRVHAVLATLAASCWATAAVCAPVASKDYAIGPPPAWVTPIRPDRGQAVPSGQVSDGVHFLLVDIQVRLETRDRASFRHYASRALNAKGLETIANIEIPFDPSYQTVTVHSIDVRRGERSIGKIDSSALRVISRESDREYQIFDGRKVLHVFLDDVRLGDVVEYAYTLRGYNPVFGDRHYGRFDLQSGIPLGYLHARLVVPEGRAVRIAQRNTDIKPVEARLAGAREYRWTAHDIAARPQELDVPGWFDATPSLEFSEFQDWGAVAKWASPLYRIPDDAGPEIHAEIARIAQGSSDAGERLLATLRFVQQDVRYLGIEIGPGSHAPNPPQVVLARRFGDCKDKSMLLVTMLAGLGIEARPALVNTKAERGIADRMPTPGAFNHVLVRARVDGRVYWIDPTRWPQTAKLSAIHQPDYGVALLLNSEATGLTSMSTRERASSKRATRAVLDAQAQEEPGVRYTVTTSREGAAAESIRFTFATENRENLQKQYLEYYAHYFPGISMSSPIEVTDDEASNRVTTTERYIVPDFWHWKDASKRWEGPIYVPDFAEFLRAPRSVTRTSPFRVIHPIEITHTTEVLLPREKWNIPDETVKVEDSAFKAERKTTYKDHRLVLIDRYTSLADHVPAADTSRFAANIERARDNLSLSLTRKGPAQRSAGSLANFNGVVAMWALMVAAAIAALAVRLYRYDPPPVATTPRPALQGIRGWLALAAIGVTLAPVRTAIDASQLVPSLGNDVWSTMTSPGNPAFNPAWAPVLMFEVGANIAIVLFGVLLAVLFFGKRTSVPAMFIALTAGSIVVNVVDAALGVAVFGQSLAAKDSTALATLIIVGSAWIAYFLRSKRVQATFVNRYAATPQATVTAPAGT